MRRAFFSLLLLAPVPAMAASAECDPFVDAALVSPDGKFLGRFSSKYDGKSIFNKYGTYGSKYASDSIWNPYGDYGSPYAEGSAFNPYSTEPPLIVKNRTVIGRLSKNKYLDGAVDPMILAVVCFDFDPN